ncbi:tripartite tricarboxylate transporter TctB family protein [Microbacterium sp. gxy059]|uniref:tripartite tricarboxylate transporter TctB family protein n=1 Tax=Microbacterium sp. gxy059 TaxID=2957199 RepID=UPI003D96F08C
MSETTHAPRRVRRGVVAAYGVIALIGAAFFALSFEYDFFRYGDQVGPGFLPRVAGMLALLLGIALIVQEIRTGSVLLGDSGVEEDGDTGMSRASMIKLLTVFGLIILAVLLVPVLGLIPPLVLLVGTLTIVIERMPILPSILVAALAAAIAYALFVLVLRVPIPMGVFEGIL